jgi:hypothetical protein
MEMVGSFRRKRKWIERGDDEPVASQTEVLPSEDDQKSTCLPGQIFSQTRILIIEKEIGAVQCKILKKNISSKGNLLLL